MKPEQIRIAHHGRTVDCTCWWPETSFPVPAVIVAHGYNGCGEDAAALGEYLAQRGTAALCLSLCGGSTRDSSGFPTTSMTLYTERDDILAALDWAEANDRIDHVFLFGESMGGMASVLASVMVPERIAGLGLLYPALCIADNWRERFPEITAIPDTTDFWGMALGRTFFTSIRELDIFSLLPVYDGPVLIMHGEDDATVPVAYSERAAKLYQNATLRIFPHEGHGFSQTGAMQVHALLAQFIHNHRGNA